MPVRSLACWTALMLLAACAPTVTPVRGTPTPGLMKLPLACRLPLAAPRPGAGGFVNFPAATFTADASSLQSYDTALNKWLPVPRTAISPDGRRYAYVDNRPDPFVNVVDVATGGLSTTEIISVWKVATAARLNVSAMSVLGFDREGIYLEKIPSTGGGPAHGLALLNPDTLTYQDPAPGAVDSQTYVAVRDGVAYAATDETTGSTTFLGFDAAGNPLVAANAQEAYRILSGSAAIYTAAAGDADNPTGPAVADAHGVWFGSTSGVVWYYPGGGKPLERVAVAPFQPAAVAGPCA